MATSRLQPYDEARARALHLTFPQRPISPRIEKYDVTSEIGHGDLVRVFRANDRDLGRSVTLKVLTDLAGSALSRRFRSEVASAAKLRTPHIIAIYSLGEHVGLPFAAMQVLGEDDLRQAIRAKRPLSVLQKMLVLWQVAEGVRAANLGGLAYVGLRPSGIALENGTQAIIQDFGIVRLNPETEHEAVFYAAPEEQSGNFPPDALCDIFGFGTICYEWLAGAHPFHAGDLSGATIEYDPPRPLRDFAPECPEELERLVHRAIDVRREFRYQSLDELQDDAEPLLRELKREHSKTLLADAQRLIDAKELEEAQSVLREVLQIDPDNRKAHRLRTDVRSLLVAQTLRPRIAAILCQAEQESSAGDFGRVVELLESAQRLDDTDAEVSRRLEQARSRLVQNCRSAALVAEARQFLEKQAFTEARAKVSEALETDPGSADAAGLLRAIDEALEHRNQETQIEAGLVRAKSFLLLEEFESAIAILSGLQNEFPGSPVVDHWLEHVRKQAAEANRQRRLQARMEEGRALMAERRFNGAILVLTELITEFPGEPQIQEMLDQAYVIRKREEAAALAEAQCHELCGENQFEKALAVLDAALLVHPGEPGLIGLRHEVEERWQELKSGAEVHKALSQVDWLLDQGRPDLAAQFLRDKAEEYPGQEDLVSRLAEIRKILPGWEMARFIEDTLGRVASLEQLEQWSVALTVVEEGLETYPSAPELVAAAARLRKCLSDLERRKKLGRRLEAIRQRISTLSWPEARLLIEAAQIEFPGEPELDSLFQSVEDGRRRSESDNIIREVRQCLADGEPEQAEEILRKGIEALPRDAAIRGLQKELQADREYREEWRTAQVLFGRRQFQKAEQILVRLAAPNRPEIALLLEKVREGRAASEEEDFYKSGREKALKLIREQQFEQAADLLRNLLTLFPGDPILERDLQSVQAQCDQSPPAAPHDAPEEAVELEITSLNSNELRAGPDAGHSTATASSPSSGPSPAPARVPSQTVSPSLVPKSQVHRPVTRTRRLGLIGTLLLLVSASAAAWKLSRSASRVVAPPKASASLSRSESPVTAPAVTAAAVTADHSGPPAAPTETPATDPALPPDSESRGATRSARSEPKTNPATPTRPFTMPPPTASRDPQAQAVPLPTPPGAALASSTANLPASLTHSQAPVPPAPTPAADPPKVAPAVAAPAIATGGHLQEAQLVSAPKPVMPDIARQQRINGTVNLLATVDVTGKVKDVKVLNGHPLLSGAAAASVSKWRYVPATLNGKPIETAVDIKVVFSTNRD